MRKSIVIDLEEYEKMAGSLATLESALGKDVVVVHEFTAYGVMFNRTEYKYFTKDEIIKQLNDELQKTRRAHTDTLSEIYEMQKAQAVKERKKWYGF